MAFDFIARAVAQNARSAVAPLIWRQRASLEAGSSVGTPSETAARLQAQINALGASGGGTLRLIEDVITIDRPLLVPYGVSVIGPGRNRCLIRSTFSDTAMAWQQGAIFTTGNFVAGATSGFWTSGNAKALNAAAKGDVAATLTNGADASGFTSGDIVVFCSNNFYIDGAGSRIANYMAIRKVLRIVGATLYLDEPFFDAFTGFAYNMRTNTILGVGNTVGGAGVPLFVWGDAELSGFSVDTVGTWLNGASAAFKGRYADVEVQRSRRLWYGNTFQHCLFDGVSGRFMGQAGELSLNSENTVVRNWTASFDVNAQTAYWPATPPSGGFSMQENGIANTFRDGTLIVTGMTGSNPVISINNFERAIVDNVEIFHGGPSFGGDVVAIGNGTTVAGRREAKDARINVRWNGPCARYLGFANANTTGCTVNGDFRGPVSSGEAFRFTGTMLPNVISRNARFEQGRGKLASGVINQEIIGCYVGGGMDGLAFADYTQFAANNVREIRTASSASRRGGTNAITAINSTGTTEADVVAGSIGAGTLQRQDMIEFSARISLAGVAGTKTINFKLVNTTDNVTFVPASFVIPAAATGVIEISGRVHVTALNVLIPEAAASNSTVTINKASINTDLTGKALDIKLTAVRASAADSASIAMARFSLTNPVQN